MRKLMQTVAMTVMGLGMMLAMGCSAIQVPTQGAPTGVVRDYPSRTPIRSLPLTTQAGNQDGSKKVNVYADGTVALTGLPWFQQGTDRTCAQANIASVMNYWGHTTTYQNVVNEMNPSNLPTDVVNVSTYLRGKGLYAQDYRKATINFLKKQVNDGKPTIVMIDFGDLASEHYVTVKGYNDKTGEVLYNDPVDGPNMLLDYASFEKMWQNRSLQAVPFFGDKYAGIAFDVAVK